MIDWLSKERRERKRKEAQEKQLRASLSAKLSRYEQSQHDSKNAAAEDDHTELVLGGKKIRVAKKQITLTDIKV